jgi:hypothetical protein
MVSEPFSIPVTAARIAAFGYVDGSMCFNDQGSSRSSSEGRA